jgi:hypothetical protein
MTRALKGVAVVALEADRTLPGIATNTAQIRHVPDINGPGLIEALLLLKLPSKPVLLLTNDRMVQTVGRHYEAIADRY